MTRLAALSRRLTARVLFFMSIALLPLGIVGVIQNQRLVSEIERRSELSLLALTEQAVSGETQLLQRTFGAAEAIGEVYELLRGDSVACNEFMQRFLAANERFAFVGFTTPDGISTCSSAGRELDFSGDPNFSDLVENPRPSIEVNLQAPGSGQSVLIVNEPTFDDDVFLGYSSISLPVREVGESTDFLGDPEPLSLVTFSVTGELLSTEQQRARAEEMLPANIPLAELAEGISRTFTARDTQGRETLYSVVPVKPGIVYALGSWRTDRVAENTVSPFVTASLPILMWLSSVGIVWLVIERFVIDRIRRLNRSMAGFADDRTMPRAAVKNEAREFAQLDRSFRAMAHDILEEEEALEDQLRQKTVLLKEVHHRVKNNLQIVSSIVNIQMRKVHSDETRVALGQVRDRILALSGVHRLIYQAESLTRVNAASLIEEIIEQTLTMGQSKDRKVHIDRALTEVILFPDQAVSVAMWVAETLTNAIKYSGMPPADIRVSLSLNTEHDAQIEVSNSVSDTGSIVNADEIESTGLGQRLIQAFAFQLNGDMSVEETDSVYTVRLIFPVEDFRPEPKDY